MFNHRLFHSAPTLGQIAVNGEWEYAIEIGPGEFWSVDTASNYLNTREEVAIEAFFGNAFFGIRRRGTPESLSKFISTFTGALNSRSGEDFFNQLTSLLNIKLGEKLHGCEIGAVNAWKSVGPFQISQPLEAVNQLDILWRDLSLAPVSLNSSHLKSIEFIFDNGDGTTHWFALPLTGTTPPYSIELAKLRDALVSCQDWCQNFA